MSLLKKAAATAAVLAFLLTATPVAAFVSQAAKAALPQTETSTTLYYRDDVPPIGSAPKWETPNDFDQFLTQCTIQSFTFLLQSLRDDPTVRWLEAFTDAVYEESSKETKDEDAKKSQKKKVSLAEAAQSALLETEKALHKGKVVLPKKLEDTVGPIKKQKNVMNVATLATIEKKASKKSSFKIFSVHASQLAQNLKKNKLSKKEETTKKDIPSISPPQEEGPLSNTDIGQLYSSIPRKQQPQNGWGKNSYSPFGPKPKAVSPSPMSANGKIGGGPFFKPSKKKEEPRFQQSPFGNKSPKPPASEASTNNPRSFSPFGGNTDNKSGEGFKPVPSTSPLYNGGAAPRSREEKKPEEKIVEEDSAAPSVLKYHGLGILNNTKFPTWDAYFEQMLDQPKELFVVQYNNADIELDIDPASLCRRMISVRGQIAEEFEHDLQVIADMGGLTLKSYHKMNEEIREQRAEEELQQQKDDLENLMPKSMEDSISNNNGAKATDDVDQPQPGKPQMQRANLFFLDRGVGEGDKADLSPSPLRRGNFDLLCLMATQVAIHRVLNDPSRQARKSAEHGSNQFLQDFYVTRLLSHFSGDQPYGRADDFLEELLHCPPRMITLGNTNDDKPESGDDGHEDSLTKDLIYLVNPVKVAETILNEREVVVHQWKQHLADQTKEDHMAIQKMVLAKVMGGTVEECEVVHPDGNDVDDVDFGSCFE